MDTYQHSAHLLKYMAHPMRLQILDRLRAADECVCHLAAVLAKPQPYVSQQLAVLRKAGLICDRKDGTHIYYGLAAKRDGREVSAVLDAVLPAPADAARGHKHVAGCCCPLCAAPNERSVP
jgi:ArsR family transcriptional regulator